MATATRSAASAPRARTQSQQAHTQSLTSPSDLRPQTTSCCAPPSGRRQRACRRSTGRAGCAGSARFSATTSRTSRSSA
eukprot:4716549-Prymnesium_polylepis.1